MNRKILFIMVTIAFSMMVFAFSRIGNDFISHSINSKTNTSSNIQNNSIDINLLGKRTLSINEDRINNEVYGVGHLDDNRWELEEIDQIMNQIKGVWYIGEYVGFVDSTIYYPDLYDSKYHKDELSNKELILEYEKKVENAKSKKPANCFSVKEIKFLDNWKDTSANCIFVEGWDPSPVNIVLSIDRSSDNYPVFVDATTITKDFWVEYPVLYIKFFIRKGEDLQPAHYESATLVLSSDNKFYFLMDGAFYTLKKAP